jgi:hypothetical protein
MKFLVGMWSIDFLNASQKRCTVFLNSFYSLRIHGIVSLGENPSNNICTKRRIFMKFTTEAILLGFILLS